MEQLRQGVRNPNIAHNANTASKFVTKVSSFKGVVIMHEKKRIKIIKKGEAAGAKTPEQLAPRRAAREVVQNVTEWVSDLKTRKSEETRAALDMLFGNTRTEP
jgi:hypothetical protein